MSEEKKLPQATVTVEYDGETHTFQGHAFALCVIDGKVVDSCSNGFVNMGEALDLMDALGRHIGRVASCKGLPGSVAEAMAADGIRKQTKKDSFSNLLTHLDAALEKCEECEECQEADSKES